MPERVVLQSGKRNFVDAGHPWIFSGAIDRIEGEVATSGCVAIHATNGDHLGWGLYSPASEIRVRQLPMPADFDGTWNAEFIADLVCDRTLKAFRRRQRIGLPDEQTDAYRVLNSEGDGLPGVILDRYGDTAVLQRTTRPWHDAGEAVVDGLRRAVERHQNIDALRETDAPSRIADAEDFETTSGWHLHDGETPPEKLEFRESSVRYELPVDQGQKTGHYADLRELRQWLARHSHGADLLDGYSYTGAVALTCMAHGAQSATCVDTSEWALERADALADLNDLRVETVHQDIEDYLRSAYDRERQFDTIILDPPKLAPSQQDVGGAMKVYRSMTIQASRLLADDGLLALTSCSSSLGQKLLERALGAATSRTGRAMTVVRSGTAGPDHPHPATMHEGDYMSWVVATPMPGHLSSASLQP